MKYLVIFFWVLTSEIFEATFLFVVKLLELLRLWFASNEESKR